MEDLIVGCFENDIEPKGSKNSFNFLTS